jgi:hypothetical protein
MKCGLEFEVTKQESSTTVPLPGFVALTLRSLFQQPFFSFLSLSITNYMMGEITSAKFDNLLNLRDVGETINKFVGKK